MLNAQLSFEAGEDQTMVALNWWLKFMSFLLLIFGSVKNIKALNDVEIFFLNFDKELLEYNKRVSALAWDAV